MKLKMSIMFIENIHVHRAPEERYIYRIEYIHQIKLQRSDIFIKYDMPLLWSYSFIFL